MLKMMTIIMSRNALHEHQRQQRTEQLQKEYYQQKTQPQMQQQQLNCEMNHLRPDDDQNNGSFLLGSFATCAPGALVNDSHNHNK